MIEFLGLDNANVRWVMLGMIFLGINSALIGSFAYLKQKTLVGDAISHAILPGICIGFLISGQKNTYFLLLGAIFTGWLALQSINYLINYTKIKSDGAIALVLSVFYGFGVVLLTMIQSSGNAEQSGLDKFLFGKAASMVAEDVILAGIICGISVLFIYLFFQPLRIMVFDSNFAKVRGYQVIFLENSLSILLVIAVAIGIQALGIVLMAALLVTPPASARYWTNSLFPLLWIACLISVVSSFFGALVSYHWSQMPTGPWVVIFLSFFAFFSVLFGKKIRK